MAKSRKRRIPLKKMDRLLMSIADKLTKTQTLKNDAHITTIEGLKQVRVIPPPIKIANHDSTVSLTVQSGFEQPITTTIAVDFTPIGSEITSSFTDEPIGQSSVLINKILMVVSTLRVGITSDVKKVFYFLELKENGNSIYKFSFNEEVSENIIQFSHTFQLV